MMQDFVGSPQDGRGDRWEPAREVAPIPTGDQRREIRFVQLYAVSVKLELIQPTFILSAWEGLDE